MYYIYNLLCENKNTCIPSFPASIEILLKLPKIDLKEKQINFPKLKISKN